MLRVARNSESSSVEFKFTELSRNASMAQGMEEKSI